MIDYLIVGSGLSGAHMAQTLSEAGLSIVVCDPGEQYSVPQKNFGKTTSFMQLREKDDKQSEYFLGKDFEGMDWASDGHSLTPPRNSLLKKNDNASDFKKMESHAFGGFGGAWGAGCSRYTSAELKLMGLDEHEMKEAYQTVADRIGLSGQSDDISNFCSYGLKGLQPPMGMSDSIESLYKKYLKKKSFLNTQGVFVGKTPMAVLTEDKGSRKACDYSELEFYFDEGHSVYRSWMTLNELIKESKVSYLGNTLVQTFTETSNQVEVQAVNKSGEVKNLKCKNLILCSGTFGTAKIVLKSCNNENSKLPLLTNAYTLTANLNLNYFGNRMPKNQTALGQLDMYCIEGEAAAEARMLSFYTYRSHLLHKIVKEFPFGIRGGKNILSLLQSSLVIASINHPDSYNLNNKFISMSEDELCVVYKKTDSERRVDFEYEKRILSAFKKMGLITLSRQAQTPGSTVHYAGSLGIDKGTQDSLHVGTDGRLNGTRRVRVADSSGFQFLPANGLSFTIMAHAHNIARKIIEESL